jgi:alanyl-tRNA synthetase
MESQSSSAERSVRSLVRAGYRRFPPRGLAGAAGDPTLLISPATASWQSWLLAGASSRGGGSVVPQWCVRTTRLESPPTSGSMSAQRMIGAVWLGRRPYTELLSHLLDSVEAVGLPPERASYLVPADGGQDTDSLRQALGALGVPESSVVVGPQSPATPLRMHPELGPHLSVEFAVGPGCSGSCAPGCLCGRYLHLWDCQFTERSRTAAGQVVPTTRPVFELLGTEEALACALGDTTDPFALPPLRELVAGIAALLPGVSADDQRARQGLRVIADHARAAALLLGTGSVPGPRGRTYITRQLLRRAGAEMVLLGGPLAPLPDLVALAARLHRADFGFPALPGTALRLTAREADTLERLLVRGRARYLRVVQRCSPEQLPSELLRLRSEHGVPLMLLLDWCRRDGIPVRLDRLAALDLDARRGSGR